MTPNELLQNSDWHYAFTEANADIRRAHPTRSEPELDPIDISDIDKVVAYVEGENDGPNWLVVGVANDGRWFMMSAGCDYTGWDCQAGGTLTVAHGPIELMAWGMTNDDKQRLGGMFS